MLDASSPAALLTQQFVEVSISDNDETANSNQSASFELSSETQISWNAIVGASHYELLIYSTVKGQESLRVESLDTTTYRPSALNGPDSYQMFVRATDDSGQNSLWSNPVYFDIMQPATTSPVLESPSFISTAGNSIPTLDWTTSSAATGYNLLIYSVSAGREVLNRTGITDGSFEAISLAGVGDEYQAFVRSSNSQGQSSSWSLPAYFTVSGESQTSQPPDSKDEVESIPRITTAVDLIADTTPTLTWREVASAAYYQVHVYHVATGSLVADLAGMSRPELTLKELTVFGTHTVYVRAFSSLGVAGGWSTPWEFALVNLQDDVQSGELLKEMIYRELPQLRGTTVDDFTRVNLLREWAFRNIDWGATSTLRPSVYFSQSAPAVFSWYFQDRAGTFCGGSAYALRKLYELFGYEAYTMGFGRLDVMTHASTLVRILHGGRSLLSVQDATFNLTYVDVAGNPYDYYKLLETLRSHRLDLVVEAYGVDQVRETIVTTLNELGSYRLFLETDFSNVERLSDGRYKFRSVLTLERFIQVWGAQAQIAEFLKSEGFAEDMIYLYLYPFQSNSLTILENAQFVAGALDREPITN